MLSTKSYITRRYQDVSLAVTDKDSGVLGWIWFYRDTRHPLPVRVQSELGLTPGNCRIYQLSYEKLLSHGWTAKILRHTQHVSHEYLHTPRKGVIVEGLRQAIIKLADEFAHLYGTQKKLVFYAFVSSDNIPSRKVLIQNDFAKIERSYKYDGALQDLWVKIS